jgi:NAD(P)-dependent dehydrogenase (short-subunit alcohol dehydrogenase family)
VFVCVEGYNASSANLFSVRGFTILSSGELLRRYGFLGTHLLWLRTSCLGGDVRRFLWGRPEVVAAVVGHFLVSGARFVTGQCYNVSGGRATYW